MTDPPTLRAATAEANATLVQVAGRVVLAVPVARGGARRAVEDVMIVPVVAAVAVAMVATGQIGVEATGPVVTIASNTTDLH